MAGGEGSRCLRPAEDPGKHGGPLPSTPALPHGSEAHAEPAGAGPTLRVAERAEAGALPWRWVLPIAAVPAIIAVVQLGRIHPDEVYQVLEPAYRRAFGYGIQSWEWTVGLRNWAIPLLFAGLLKAAAAVGLTHPLAYRAVLEVPQFVLHAAMLVSVYRYAARRVDGRLARWAVVLVGLHAPVVTFAGRTLGESFSAAFLVIALELLDRGGRRPALGAGVMFGLAVVARYGSGVVVIAALAWLLGARRFRALWLTCAAGGAVAAALAGLDWATWGAPFHSLRQYVEFNVTSGRAAAQFGEAPPTFYLPLLKWVPLWAWAAALGAGWRPWRSLPLVAAGVYLAAIAATPHKEYRFAYPALVLLAMAAAPRALGLLASLRRPDLKSALLSLAVCASAGPYFLPSELQVERPEQFQAIVQASSEATGLLIVNEGIWGAGGYFYVGKNIPWFTCDWPSDPRFVHAMRDPRFNRAITYDGRALAELQAAGFRVVDRIGRETVLARP